MTRLVDENGVNWVLNEDGELVKESDLNNSAALDVEETNIPTRNGHISNEIKKLKKKAPLINAKNRPDFDDIRKIPALTSQDIEDAINAHKDNKKYPHKFKIGGIIGRGAFASVYKLLYVDESPKARFSSMKKNYVVKVIDPIHSFLQQFGDYQQATPDLSLEYLKKNIAFQHFLHQRNEALKRITHLSEKNLDKDNIAKYYSELSFEMESPVPFVTVIVMEEAVCTLKDFAISNDLDLKIRRMFKVGLEIGHALQACEYPENEGIRFNHRDVKPFNIGVRFTGEGPDYFEYILIDCESGRVVSDQDSSNTIIQTKNFAAPELNDVNHEMTDDGYRLADQYSLGAVLAYILHPENWRDYRSELVNHDYISSVIDICLQENPQNRYIDFQEMTNMLEEAKQRYFKKNIGNAVSDEEINAIREKYLKRLEEKENELTKQASDFRAIRDNYERQLTKKDKDIAEAKEKAFNAAKDIYTKELEKKTAELTAQLTNKAQAAAEDVSAKTDPDYVISVPVKAITIQRNRELSQTADKFSKKIDEAKKLSGRIRITEQVVDTFDKCTISSKYQYYEIPDGYIKHLTSNLCSNNKDNENVLMNNNLARICKYILTIEQGGKTIINEGIQYTYWANGTYVKEEMSNDKVQTREFFSSTHQLERKKVLHIPNEPGSRDYTFKYVPTSSDNRNFDVYQGEKSEGFGSTPDYSYSAEYWANGNIKATKIVTKGSHHLLVDEWNEKTSKFDNLGNINVEEYESISSSKTTKYIKDLEGRCINEIKIAHNQMPCAYFRSFDCNGVLLFCIKTDAPKSPTIRIINDYFNYYQGF